MKQLYLQLNSKRPIGRGVAVVVTTIYLFNPASNGWDEEKLCKGPPGRTPCPESY